MSLQMMQDFVHEFLITPETHKNILATPSATQQISLYRQLILNTVDSVLSSIYPYTKIIMTECWDEIISHFFECYLPTDYRVFKLAEPFKTYLENTKNKQVKKIIKIHPYLLDLVVYEWREVDIANQVFGNDLPLNLLIPSQSEPSHLLLSSSLVWNPVQAIDNLSFDIPAVIEHIKNENIEILDLKLITVETTIVQFRNLLSHEVVFFVLNPFTKFVMEITLTNPLTLREVMQQIQQTFHLEIDSESELLQQALPWLAQCYETGLLLGCAKA